MSSIFGGESVWSSAFVGGDGGSEGGAPSGAEILDPLVCSRSYRDIFVCAMPMTSSAFQTCALAHLHDGPGRTALLAIFLTLANNQIDASMVSLSLSK